MESEEDHRSAIQQGHHRYDLASSEIGRDPDDQGTSRALVQERRKQSQARRAGRRAGDGQGKLRAGFACVSEPPENFVLPNEEKIVSAVKFVVVRQAATV
jgi:hypothetical protein